MTYVINLKEVNSMPRRDGTGPMGLGYANGRCFGFCTGANAARYGSEFSTKTHKELLQEQKDLLKMRLDAIDKQLENL